MDAVGGSEESAGCEPSTVADDVLEARIPALRVLGTCTCSASSRGGCLDSGGKRLVEAHARARPDGPVASPAIPIAHWSRSSSQENRHRADATGTPV